VRERPTTSLNVAEMRTLNLLERKTKIRLRGAIPPGSTRIDGFDSKAPSRCEDQTAVEELEVRSTPFEACAGLKEEDGERLEDDGKTESGKSNWGGKNLSFGGRS